MQIERQKDQIRKPEQRKPARRRKPKNQTKGERKDMALEKDDLQGQEGKRNRLATAPLRRLIFQMALPSVAAQLVNLLYNIVDRIYVGHIPGEGTMALAGLGITFPVLILITSFSNLIGIGGSNRASIAMGKGDYDCAERIMGNCFTMIISLSILLSAVLLLFRSPVLIAFGASEAILPYANDYLFIYLLGTIFVMITLGLNPFITNQGFAKTSMATTCIGAVLNILFDPLFIYGFGMGVKGAAAATVLSQAVSAVWVLSFLNGRKSMLKIRLEAMRLDKAVIVSIVSLGISPFVMNATECLIQLTFNNGMQAYGNDLYVSLMSIMFSVNQAVWMPIQGFAQGVQPIIGYNYGAGNIRRVWKSFYTMLAVCFACSVVMVGSMLLWPAAYLGMFTDHAELIEMGIRPMRVFMFGMMFMGAQCACQQTFLGLGQAKISIFIAMLRKVILLWPLAMILPKVMNLGVWGLYLAEPISDCISVATCTVLFFVTAKRRLLAVPE